MTLASDASKFSKDLVNLWDTATASTTIFQTADLLEAYWSGAVVAGGVSSATTFAPRITYAPFSPLQTPAGTPATAAAVFEQALSTMVLGTVFTPIAPAIITPPNIPVGPALPGVLTAALMSIFNVLSPVSVASTVANLLTTYLQSWTVAVTIPPAGPVPTPIV